MDYLNIPVSNYEDYLAYIQKKNPTEYAKLNKQYRMWQEGLLAQGLCPHCENYTVRTHTETRLGGHWEFVTYCGFCGVTYCC